MMKIKSEQIFGKPQIRPDRYALLNRKQGIKVKKKHVFFSPYLLIYLFIAQDINPLRITTKHPAYSTYSNDMDLFLHNYRVGRLWML